MCSATLLDSRGDVLSPAARVSSEHVNPSCARMVFVWMAEGEEARLVINGFILVVLFAVTRHQPGSGKNFGNANCRSASTATLIQNATEPIPRAGTARSKRGHRIRWSLREAAATDR